MTCEVPVLLIIFNRPDLTAEVVKALRKVRPRRLFIAADAEAPDAMQFRSRYFQA